MLITFSTTYRRVSFKARVSTDPEVKDSPQLHKKEAASLVLKEDNGITFIPLSFVSSSPFAPFSCPVARRLPLPPSARPPLFLPKPPSYNTLSQPHRFLPSHTA